MESLVVMMLVLPLCGALLLAFSRGAAAGVTRWTALAVTVATLVVAVIVAGNVFLMPVGSGGGSILPRWQMEIAWLEYSGATGKPLQLQFLIGLDSISASLIVLTALLSVASVMISWRAIDRHVTAYFAWLLVLETGMLGVFCAFDVLLFYVFFEFTLIPLFFLIGIWGGEQRQRAARRFFIYTLCGSFATLVGLVWLVLAVIERSTLQSPFSLIDIARELQQNPLPGYTQVGIFLLISAGFAIKTPLVPFHTWLPLAHVEAPTAGSVLLAGVLLKLGTYGFLRVGLTLFPYACMTVGIPLFGTLAVIGIIYGALGALAQSDIKRLVAYSSVSHMGFCMLGLFALNVEGVTGGILQMINHGLSTSGLFLVIGMLYERYHTRQMGEMGGLAARLPLLTLAMVVLCLSSIGLPGLNGFVGEFLSLAGMFRVSPWLAIAGTAGVVLGAWYLLTLLQQTFFGPLREPQSEGPPPRDLSWREGLLLSPILAMCLYLGVYPQPLIEKLQPDVERIVEVYRQPVDTTIVAGASAVEYYQ